MGNYIKQSKEIIICPSCLGQGIIEEWVHTRDENNLYLIKCPNCNGNGRMTRTITIEDEPFISKL